MIRPSADEKFGDYQSNVAMGLAKRLGAKPRDVAQKIVDALAADPQSPAMCQPFEIAGPGFINIRLRPEWMADVLNAIPAAGDRDRLGIEPADKPQTVVVDYSGPNIAKQMHVGHLRSTIIGDTIARILEFEGHRVIRQNHIGDWGTQFGMLCAYLKEKMPDALDRPERRPPGRPGGLLPARPTPCDKEDAGFHERARAEVVALHNHDETTLRAWRYIVDESRQHYMPVYRRLGVQLTQEDERGESFYAERLPDVVAELGTATSVQVHAAGRARRPHGGDSRASASKTPTAPCASSTRPPPASRCSRTPRASPLPMIIRKSDGAFLYATTDLAALRFRIRELGADRIIYVTDARQAQHFEMVFATVRAAGWTHARRHDPRPFSSIT